MFADKMFRLHDLMACTDPPKAVRVSLKCNVSVMPRGCTLFTVAARCMSVLHVMVPRCQRLLIAEALKIQQGRRLYFVGACSTIARVIGPFSCDGREGWDCGKVAEKKVNDIHH